MKLLLIIVLLLLLSTAQAAAQDQSDRGSPGVQFTIRGGGADGKALVDAFDFQYWQPFFEINFRDEDGNEPHERLSAFPEAGFKYFVKPGAFLKFWVEYGGFMFDYDELRLDVDKDRSAYAVNLEIAW